MVRQLFLLWSMFAFSFSWCIEIIPAELVEGLFPGEKAYTIHLFVGTPPESMQFEITFKTDAWIIYRNQRIRSVSYTEESGGSDIVYFGSKHMRLSMIYDPTRELYGEHSHCMICQGMIGLGRGSPFWQLWSEASFTSASITVGGINSLMESGIRGCSGCIIGCNTDIVGDKCMCITEGRLENYFDGPNVEESSTYSLQISIDSPVTYLPSQLYDRYMAGKNVYKDDYANDWDPIKIVIPQIASMDTHMSENLLSKGIDVSSCDTSLHLEIDPGTLVREFEVEGKSLLLRENPDPNDTSITLGNSMWNQFIFYRAAGGNYVYVQHHPVHDQLSLASILIFAVLFWYLIRWKMTDMNLEIGDRGARESGNWVNTFYELTGPILALVALLLPNARDILSDFPVLYTLSIIIYVVAVLLDLVVMGSWMIIWLWKRPRALSSMQNVPNYVKRNSYNMFRINFLRNITHETILMIAMWVILVERRTEGISSVLTVVVNVYNLYNITFHSTLFILFLVYAGREGIMQSEKDDVPSVLWVLTVLIMPLLLGFQVFASYTYFTAPLFMRNAQIYKDIILPALVAFYLIIVNIAVFMVSLYTKKSSAAIVEQYLSSKKSSNTKVLSMHNDPMIIRAESNEENEEKDEEKDETAGIVRLVDKGLAVIIGLVSNFIFGVINIKPNRLELGVLVILVFLLWVALYDYTVTWIKHLRVLKNNKTWQEVLLNIMDFIYLLGIFLVLELVLEFLKTGIGKSDPSLLEILVGIYALMLAGFSVVQSVKSLS